MHYIIYIYIYIYIYIIYIILSIIYYCLLSIKRWSHIHNSSCMLRLQILQSQGFSKGGWKSCSWVTLVFRITPDQRKPCLTMPHSDYSNYFTIQIYIIHLVKAQKHKRCSPKAPPATLHNFGSLLLQQLIVIDVPVTRQLGGCIFALLVLPSFSFVLYVLSSFTWTVEIQRCCTSSGNRERSVSSSSYQSGIHVLAWTLPFVQNLAKQLPCTVWLRVCKEPRKKQSPPEPKSKRIRIHLRQQLQDLTVSDCVYKRPRLKSFLGPFLRNLAEFKSSVALPARMTLQLPAWNGRQEGRIVFRVRPRRKTTEKHHACKATTFLAFAVWFIPWKGNGKQKACTFRVDCRLAMAPWRAEECFGRGELCLLMFAGCEWKREDKLSVIPLFLFLFLLFTHTFTVCSCFSMLDLHGREL